MGAALGDAGLRMLGALPLKFKNSEAIFSRGFHVRDLWQGASSTSMHHKSWINPTIQPWFTQKKEGNRLTNGVQFTTVAQLSCYTLWL